MNLKITWDIKYFFVLKLLRLKSHIKQLKIDYTRLVIRVSWLGLG